MAKILVVDDDEAGAARLKEWLRLEGHIVELVGNGNDALQLLSAYNFDVVILDWMLPDITGLEVCRRFRESGGLTRIIFLTGQNDISRKEQGLDAGSDDYLVKPFEVRELSARIRTLLRRPPQVLSVEIALGGVKLDPKLRMLTVDGTEVALRPKECALLEYLMRHPNSAFNARALLDSVWPSESEASVDTVRTWMLELRRKLTKAGKEQFIRTIPGMGYMIEITDAK